LATILVAPFALWVAIRDFLRRYYAVSFRGGYLEINRAGGSQLILASDVIGLVGLGGVNLDGGEMVAWKRLVVLTWDDHFSLEFNRHDNAWLYQSLRKRCPHAWGIPFRGHLQPSPQQEETASENMVALRRLEGYYRGRIIRSLILSLALGIGCIAGIALMIASPRIGDRTPRGAIWLVVLTIIAILSIVDVMRSRRVLSEIAQVSG
jgi:hypothetical protein